MDICFANKMATTTPCSPAPLASRPGVSVLTAASIARIVSAAQCPHDLKSINAEANVEGWVPSNTDDNAGTGTIGRYCTEIGIWKANKMATAYTTHSCSPDQHKIKTARARARS